jgi:hypothetical protein
MNQIVAAYKIPMAEISIFCQQFECDPKLHRQATLLARGDQLLSRSLYVSIAVPADCKESIAYVQKAMVSDWLAEYKKYLNEDLIPAYAFLVVPHDEAKVLSNSFMESELGKVCTIEFSPTVDQSGYKVLITSPRYAMDVLHEWLANVHPSLHVSYQKSFD